MRNLTSVALSDQQLAVIAREGSAADLVSLTKGELERLLEMKRPPSDGAGTREASRERLERIRDSPIEPPSGVAGVAYRGFGGTVRNLGEEIKRLPGALRDLPVNLMEEARAFEGFGSSEPRRSAAAQAPTENMAIGAMRSVGNALDATRSVVNFAALSAVPGTEESKISGAVLEEIGSGVTNDLVELLTEPATTIEEHPGQALLSTMDLAIGGSLARRGVIRAASGRIAAAPVATDIPETAVRAREIVSRAVKEKAPLTAEESSAIRRMLADSRLADARRAESMANDRLLSQQSEVAERFPYIPKNLMPELDEQMRAASKILESDPNAAASAVPRLERMANSLDEAANISQTVNPRGAAITRGIAQRARDLREDLSGRAGKTIQERLDDLRARNLRAGPALDKGVLRDMGSGQEGYIRNTALTRLGASSLGAVIGSVAGETEDHPFLGAIAGGILGIAGAELLLSPAYRATVKRSLSIGTKNKDDFEAVIRGIIEPFLPDRIITHAQMERIGQIGGIAAGVGAGAVAGEQIGDEPGAMIGALAGIPLGGRLGRSIGSLFRDFNPLRSFRAVFTEGGGLPEEAQIARRALRRRFAGRQQEIVDMAKRLDSLGAEEQNLVDRYWRGWVHADEMPQRVRALAEESRDLLDNLSLDVVEVGIAEGKLADVILDNVGSYVPRLYLRHEVSDDLLTVADHFRSTGRSLGKLSKKDYLKHRKDLPKDVRRAYGELTSEFDQAAPGYVLNKRGTVVAADVEYARYSNWLASSPDYAIPKELADSGEGIRFFDGAGGAKHAEWNGQIYRQVGDNKRFGALRNRYVQREVAFDLETTHSLGSSMGRILDTGTVFFKVGKVTLNPATLMRNVYSGFVLSDVGGGLSPARVDIYQRSLTDLVKRTSRYQEARNAGALGGTYVGEEIRAPLAAMQRATAGKKNFVDGAFDWLSRTTEAPLNKMQRFHEATEQTFKMALYNHARDVMGMDIAEAAEHALRYAFDYREVPHFVRVMRKSIFGAPFITFSYKAMPRMLGSAIAIGDPKRLLSFWKYPLAIGAMNEYSARKFGIAPAGRKAIETMKDVVANGLGFAGADEAKKFLPSYVGGIQILLPWKDKRERLLYFDLTWILPWGDIGEFGTGNVGRFFAKAGVPFPRQLEPSNPWLMTIGGAMTRKDIFTGKPIIKDLSTPAEALQQATSWLARIWMPPLFPGGFSARKVAQSLRGETGASGEIPGPAIVAASELAGLRTRSLDVEKARVFRGRQLREYIRQGKSEISRLLREGKNEEAKKRSDRLSEQVREKAEQLGIPLE